MKNLEKLVALSLVLSTSVVYAHEENYLKEKADGTINQMERKDLEKHPLRIADAKEEKGDNTARNKGHEEKSAVNAADAGNSKTDINLAKDIRKKIVKDKSLSSYAKNAKVIVKEGHVTLKGPVRTSDEKDKLVNTAKACAGDNNVADELEVVPQ